MPMELTPEMLMLGTPRLPYVAGSMKLPPSGSPSAPTTLPWDASWLPYPASMRLKPTRNSFNNVALNVCCSEMEVC